MEKFIFVDHRLTSSVNSGRDDVLYERNLFAIDSPFAEGQRPGGRKRHADSPVEHADFPEWLSDHGLERNLAKFVDANPAKFPKADPRDSENAEAKRAAARPPSSFFFQGCRPQVFHNGDDSTCRRCSFQNRQFLLPPKSFGILTDICSDSRRDILAGARCLYGSDSLFDVVLIDPPWTNKSVKRQRRYPTESGEDCLGLLPIADVLKEDGLLLAWYTHNATHYTALRAQLSQWGLQLAATWTWVKVTTEGRPVCPFGRNFKKPYEHLLLAAKDEALLDVLKRTDGTVLVSVPSAVHSHKPNIENVLQDFGYDFAKKRCLELFARTLKTNWVSVGNEVLKLQSVEMFDTDQLPE